MTFLKLEMYLTLRISAEGQAPVPTMLGVQKGTEKGEVREAGQGQRAGLLGNLLQVAKKLESNLPTMMRLCNLKGLQRDTCKGQHDTH